MVLGGWAFFYERGTPVHPFNLLHFAWTRIKPSPRPVQPHNLTQGDVAAGGPAARQGHFLAVANMAHIKQSRPDAGLGFQVKVLKSFQVVPFCSDADQTLTSSSDFRQGDVAAGGPAARQGRHRRPPPCLVLRMEGSGELLNHGGGAARKGSLLPRGNVERNRHAQAGPEPQPPRSFYLLLVGRDDSSHPTQDCTGVPCSSETSTLLGPS